MRHTNKKLSGLFLISLVLVLYSGCAPKPKPVSLPPGAESTEETRPVVVEPPPIMQILYGEAEKFESMQRYTDALFVYNQILVQVGQDRPQDLLDNIESLLLTMRSEEIRPFLDLKNFQVPRELLLYWYGLNAAVENNRVDAKQAFETFLFEYTEHPYAEDVADLLTTIKVSLFKKNTIGCLLPLSGKYGVFGQRALTGIQMAIQDLSDKYDQHFYLVIKDTRSDPQQAIESVRQLSEKNVAAIIGPWLTVTQAGVEAERLEIPMLGLTQKSDFPLAGEYLFSNFISPEMQVRTLADYLFNDLDVKKVAILYPDEKYGRTYMELFWDVVEKFGREIVGVEPYDGKKTDFTQAIQKLTGEFYPVPEPIKKQEEIKVRAEELGVDPADPVFLEMLRQEELEKAEQEQPEISARIEEEEEIIDIDFEALFIPDAPSKISLILPQLAFNDATGMYLVGTNLWHHKSLLKNTRGYSKKAIITDGFFGNSQNPLTSSFNERYKRLFATAPKFLEAISYDCATILFTAAMDDAVDSRQTLKDALQQGRVFQGVTGATVFDQDGRANRQLFLVTVKNGRFFEISR